MCVHVRAFWGNKFSLIPLFTFIHTLLSLKYYELDTRSSVNICRIILTPVPYSYLIDLMQCKWAFLCLSLLSGIYVSAGTQTHYFTIPKHWPGPTMDKTSASGLYDENDHYNEHIPCVVICSGLTSLSTIFQSYHNGVWLRQGAQCSFSLCCVTEVSCPRLIPHPVTLCWHCLNQS